jgi:esterase/lipase superfamily enzyme
MKFITNRFPTQSRVSKAGRAWSFDPRENECAASFFCCEMGTKVDGSHTEIISQGLFSALKASSAPHILLWIHGFNTAPAAALQAGLTMQALADKLYPGLVEIVPVIWPANTENGLIKSYYTDRIAADSSRTAFARLFEKFQEWQHAQLTDTNPCRKQISVLAHSMGNRVLRESLDHWSKEYLARGVPRLFRGVFMAAADVVNESLAISQYGPTLAHSAAILVNYHAWDDLALGGSKFANLDQVASRRLGHTGPEGETPQNVHSLDCGSFNSEADPKFGHGYYLQAKPNGKTISPLLRHVLQTIKSLRVSETDPSTRRGTLNA